MGVSEQSPGLGESTPNEELMRGFAIDLPKGSQEMILRQACDPGQVGEGDGFGEHCVEIIPGEGNAAVKLVTCRRSDGVQTFGLPKHAIVNAQESLREIVEVFQKPAAFEGLVTGAQTEQRGRKYLVVSVVLLEQAKLLRCVIGGLIEEAPGTERETVPNVIEEI